MRPIEAMALVSGQINEELLLRNQYLAEENRILRAKLPDRIPMTDIERARLARLAKDIGTKALHDLGPMVEPETLRYPACPTSRRNTDMGGLYSPAQGIDHCYRFFYGGGI